LKLTNNALGPNVVPLLAALTACQELQHLELCKNTLAASAGRALLNLAVACKKLEVLYLRDCGAAVPAMLEAMATHEGVLAVRELILDGNQLGGVVRANVWRGVLRTCQFVEYLCVSNAFLQDADVAGVAEGLRECNGLREVNLQRNVIRDDGLQCLARALELCRERPTVFVNYNAASLEAMRAFCERF
tara:strand:- start:80 stop:646 length:567 start_codon:yes stop_codon:yes gene_type:complete